MCTCVWHGGMWAVMCVCVQHVYVVCVTRMHGVYVELRRANYEEALSFSPFLPVPPTHHPEDKALALNPET